MKNINGWDKSLCREVSSESSSKSKAAIRRKLNRIRQKQNSGARLTAEEKAFLRRYAPALYEQAMTLERERAAYEERLKQCRTKEEAERVKTEKMIETSAAKEEDVEIKIMRMAQLKAAEQGAAYAVNKMPSQTEKEKKQRRAEFERRQIQKVKDRKRASQKRREAERIQKELREDQYEEEQRQKERVEKDIEARYMEKEEGIIYGRPVNSVPSQTHSLPGGIFQGITSQDQRGTDTIEGAYARGYAAYQAVLQEDPQ